MTRFDSGERVWFVTGASRGLGRAFVDEALAAGDRVVAVSRGIGTVADLDDDRVLRLPTDVTDRAAVFEAVDAGVAHFGRIDIAINNAGTMWSGFVEEFDEAQVRAQMETNFFGALWVGQAVAGVMRRQRGGHLVQISSIGGVVTGPTSGIYSASKFALEGASEALAAELAGFGVDVTIVEPGGYWTDLYTGMGFTEPCADYAQLRADITEQFADTAIDSEPALAAKAISALVDSDEPPLRLILGSAVLDAAIDAAQRRIDTWSAWEAVSRAAESAVPAPGERLPTE
ncbi:MULTISPECIES: SDR family NAD(P)-dependent oxidoreductase [unclassified Rhodococcus (in: high G+C Gram-positive bacteria)]|uniref:SDR family NAD(P)-dependent oxidoreductase n=1 Tax=Rhodococcus sp. SJ-3 TaxID=3454628 RepID=UPI003F7A26AB